MWDWVVEQSWCKWPDFLFSLFFCGKYRLVGTEAGVLGYVILYLCGGFRDRRQEIIMCWCVRLHHSLPCRMGYEGVNYEQNEVWLELWCVVGAEMCALKCFCQVLSFKLVNSKSWRRRYLGDAVTGTLDNGQSLSSSLYMFFACKFKQLPKDK